MKIITLLALCGALCTACTTTDHATVTVSDAAEVANLAAYAGAAIHLAEHPEDAPYFRAAVHALDGALASPDWQPATLAEALSALPVTELQGNRGRIYITAGVQLWISASRRLMLIDESGDARTIAMSIRDGLAQALSIP